LLKQLHEVVLIPPAVWTEITVGGANLEEARNLHQAAADGWLQVKSPVVRLEDISAQNDLGRGEIEAIALAKELGAILLTDDADARAFAICMGVKVVGTLGLIVRAKSERYISEVKPLLDQLRLSNFRMSESLYHHALKEAGEIPSS